jgi:hypothetical protein
MTYTFYEFHIPEYMEGAIQRYIDHGIPPGGFLSAVICNDLSGACGHADDENRRNIPAFVAYFYNEAPADCWGSREKMAAWIENHQKARDHIREVANGAA